MKKDSFFRRLGSYFLQGLLLVVPLALTIYIVYQLFLLLDGLIPYHPFPGAVILILVAAITLLGVLGNTFIAKRMRAYAHFLLSKVPLVQTTYTAIKDLMTAIVGKDPKFNHPVLVRLSKESNIQKIGFLTQKDLRHLGMDAGKVAVYLPHSYAFSGNLFIVDSENITPLDAPASEIMKFIVSGGVSQATGKTKTTKIAD